MLSHLLPGECDLTMTALSLLSLKSGEDVVLPADRNTTSRTRLSWWCPQDDEKLTAVVDTVLFEAGMNSQSILVANHSRNAARLACADCSEHALLRTARDGDVQIHECSCRRSLLIPEASRDFRGMFANVRASQCGLWAGPADEVSRLLGRPGPLVIARQAISMSLEFDADFALGARLRDLAIAQCVSQVCIPRSGVATMTLEGIEGSTSGNVSSLGFEPEASIATELFGVGAPSSVASGMSSLEFENWSLRREGSEALSAKNAQEIDFSANMAKVDVRQREATAEARRHRNRIAAARSNAKRKAKNDELKQALCTTLSRASELRILEKSLRLENAGLRRRLLTARANDVVGI